MVRNLSALLNQGLERPRLLLLSVLAAVLAMLAGCDPGMMIRQVNDPNQGKTTQETGIVAQVDSTDQLIGETWYDPRVKVENNSDSPLVITDIELSTREKIYTKELSGPETTFPLTVSPRSRELFQVDFRLEKDVWETFFRKPAELRLHCRLREEEKVFRVAIVGAHLDGSR